MPKNTHADESLSALSYEHYDLLEVHVSKYQDYDDKLLALIKSGHTEFSALRVLMDDLNQAIEPGDDAFRVTDRRLQSLRKAGKITFDKHRRQWSAV